MFLHLITMERAVVMQKAIIYYGVFGKQINYLFSTLTNLTSSLDVLEVRLNICKCM